jgi:hypothetical protein
MVLQQQPDLTAECASGEAPSGTSDDLAVEPVETLDASRDDPLPPALRVERLRRLALQLRVVTLQQELDREQRRRQQVTERYEQVLDEREECENRSPIFSWLRRE